LSDLPLTEWNDWIVNPQPDQLAQMPELKAPVCGWRNPHRTIHSQIGQPVGQAGLKGMTEAAG
jgi:hypothetical protein